jgi:hypothetical protein
LFFDPVDGNHDLSPSTLHDKIYSSHPGCQPFFPVAGFLGKEFFLRSPTNIPPGHKIYLDTPPALIYTLLGITLKRITPWHVFCQAILLISIIGIIFILAFCLGYAEKKKNKL